MMSGESRLQKLLHLLENATENEVRGAASQAIRDIAVSHPRQLPSILHKVCALLRRRKWDCRIAAGATLGLLAQHFVHHTVEDLRRLTGDVGDAQTKTTRRFQAEERSEDAVTASVLPGLLSFDVDEILETGTLLVACGPKLEDAANGSIEDPKLMRSLSARERNQLKRKQRSYEKGQMAGCDPVDLGDGLIPRRLSSDPSESEAEDVPDVSILDGKWPFLHAFQRLMHDAKHPVWEVRHGAVLGLRELLSWHVSCADVEVMLVPDVPSGWTVSGRAGLRDIVMPSEEEVQENETRNRRCLEDCCLRILELIILDRMGDYLSDQMVAPVRETAAQAFGCCLPSLPDETIQHILTIIDQMVHNAAWEVRHSGYTLLKYLITTQEDPTMDCMFMRCVSRGLDDVMDDVKAAAAEVLVPMAAVLSSKLSSSDMSALRAQLWSNLAEVDDLSAATPAILHLLWKLYATDAVEEEDLAHLREQLSLLFPFFQHPLVAARTYAVECFRQLLHFHSEITQFFCKAASLIFFNLLTEGQENVLQLNENAWTELLEVYDVKSLTEDFDGTLLMVMVHLACTPIGTSFDRASLEMLVDCIEEQSGEKLTVGSQFSGNPFRMRFAVCRALALFFRKLPRDVEREKILVDVAQSPSATSQLVSALIGHFWHADSAKSTAEDPQFPQECLMSVSGLLESRVAFTELLGYEIKLRNEFSSFFAEVTTKSGIGALHQALSIESMSPEEMEYQSRCLLVKLGPCIDESVAGLQQHVTSTFQTISELRQVLRVQIHACVAVVLVDTGVVPSKLNRIVQPLMAGVRTEKEVLLQNLFADRLAQLIILCRQRRSAVHRMIENVCTMACEGISFESNKKLSDRIERDGINLALGVQSSQEADQRSISKRGAESVLRALATTLSVDLFTALPPLWVEMEESLCQISRHSLRSIEVTQIIGTHLCPGLLPQLSSLLVRICCLCFVQLDAIRIAASRCCACLVLAHTETLFPVLLAELIPYLTVKADVPHREGASIALHHILEALGPSVVPYIVLLIVPLLALVSDNVPSVRLIAASCFGRLTSLLPLMPSSAPPPNLSPVQEQDFMQNTSFVAQLIDNKKTINLDLPNGITVELRNYQKEGTSWMSFLRRFGLHGILADDMGLGKTIQTLITVLLSRSESTGCGVVVLPSLVVCPATLTSHWRNEVMTLLPPDSLKPLLYVGGVADRLCLRQSLHECDLLIMSYETMRIDVDWVASQQWDYCILDEGHAIRNIESKAWSACKRIQARHRLILSGTPVQNSVLELWALFDFLIPGFLGTRKDFMSQYGRAVHAARYSKKGSVESTNSDLALSTLHKRVTPFIMRRTKDEVLRDLPPKIIQDVYCDLSPVQKCLYEDFAKASGEESDRQAPRSALETLQYLRELCSHPLLTFDWSNPTHRALLSPTLGIRVRDEAACREALSNMVHAPKLQVLQELLFDCGIGCSRSPLGDDMGGSHRMLIFAQLKGFLDIVEQQLLGPSGIPYLRIDGSVPANERGSIVLQFNSDPTIDVLLLTTKVGGLGLNLTSADVVVFLEHDWNPMNDLQAMDRAHRLGQKRTVNVYRILTRGTLEERILSLQHFKIGVANSVMNKDNISLESMDTSHLLDLFSYNNSIHSGKKDSPSKEGEVTDEEVVQRYEKEFDMHRFSKRMS